MIANASVELKLMAEWMMVMMKGGDRIAEVGWWKDDAEECRWRNLRKTSGRRKSQGGRGGGKQVKVGY